MGGRGMSNPDIGDQGWLGGPIIPADVPGLEAAARRMEETAAALRAAAARQAAHLRALHGWTGRGHDAWLASAERAGRAALAISMVLTEAAAVLALFCRTIGELRWRAAALAMRASTVGYDVAPDATVRSIGPALPAPPPGLPAAHDPPGRSLPGRSPDTFLARLEGRRLATGADPWHAVQLEAAGLLDDAVTAYTAARAGLRQIVGDQARASLAPRSARLPDGGGYGIGPLSAAVASAQAPEMREGLWELLRREAGRTTGLPRQRLRRLARAATVPAIVAAVVADRALGRPARMNAAARAVDRIVAAAGRVPVVPAAASMPLSRVPPFRPEGALRTVPIADVALTGWSVYQDVVRGGYSVPAAIGREGASTAVGYASAEATGYLIVIVGCPPASAAILAVGVGLVVGQLAALAYDKVTHDGRR
jgi:hypothetical protein